MLCTESVRLSISDVTGEEPLSRPQEAYLHCSSFRDQPAEDYGDLYPPTSTRLYQDTTLTSNDSTIVVTQQVEGRKDLFEEGFYSTYFFYSVYNLFVQSCMTAAVRFQLRVQSHDSCQRILHLPFTYIILISL